MILHVLISDEQINRSTAIVAGVEVLGHNSPALGTLELGTTSARDSG